MGSEQWKSRCWYAGTRRCYGKMAMDSDEAACRSGHPEAAQSDPIETCRWLKSWIYCPYLPYR
jgi:hypothetical protein